MLSSVSLCNLPIAGGSSRSLLPRRLRTLKFFRLNNSSGSVVRLFDARKIFNFGSSRAKTPSVTGGTRVNAARGRMVALERWVRFRDLGTSISMHSFSLLDTYERSMVSFPVSRQRSICFWASSSGDGVRFRGPGTSPDGLNGKSAVAQETNSKPSIVSSISVQSLPSQTPLSYCLSNVLLGFLGSRFEYSESGIL